MMLLETMRVSEDGSIFLIERHLDRLRNSARFFSFKYDDEGVRASIAAALASCSPPARARLTLSAGGERRLEFEPLTARLLPRRLEISRLTVDSKDPLLYHKTTDRRVYDEARRGRPTDSDVLLVNERGEATETTRANIAALRDGRWVTPPVACGLLAGVMRAELLERGELLEGVILAGELASGETIRCFNSVRGIFDLGLKL
jgi:para-aminobenzoate synthetase/4-amino-4-deoxychorismate lyase